MIKRLVYVSAMLVIISACKNGESYESASDSASYPASEAPVPSMEADQSNGNAPSAEAVSGNKKSSLPTNRKFIRTAQMSFDVENVQSATQSIETMVAQWKGYVTKSELQSVANDSRTIALSGDSLEQITTYNISTAMTIRVPNQWLDSLLIDIAHVSKFLHYRIVRADDVTAQYFTSSQKTRNFQNAQQKLDKAAEQRSGKVGDVVYSTQQSLDWANQAVDQQAGTMTLDDQISYSTLELSFSQSAILQKVRIPNQSLDDVRPSFGYEFIKSLKTSGAILREILLFIVRFWPILGLIAGFVWFIVWLQRRAVRRQKELLNNRNTN